MEPKHSSSLIDWVHVVTHILPGIPKHRATPPGYQGRSLQWQPVSNVSRPLRRPRVVVAWQRRIAAVFGFKLP